MGELSDEIFEGINVIINNEGSGDKGVEFKSCLLDYVLSKIVTLDILLNFSNLSLFIYNVKNNSQHLSNTYYISGRILSPSHVLIVRTTH